MKILKIVQKNYATLGISPSHQKYRFNKRVLVGFLLIGGLIFSQFVYSSYVANGFMEYMDCVCATFATILVFVSFATIALKQTKIFQSIDDIEKFIDTRSKCPKSEALFFNTNQKVERSSETVFIVFTIASQFLIIPTCVVSFVTYFITDSGPDSFQLPFPMWFPFDSDSPMGYLMAVIIEYIILAYEYLINISNVSFGIGGYWFATSAVKELKRILHSIDDKAKTNGSQLNELMVLLSEYIDVHEVVKQVERDFSNIFQPIFMSLFTWSLIVISSTMLTFQMEILHHENIMSILVNVTLNGLIAFALVFIVCELGQRMGDAFNEIEFTLDRFDWYLFPSKIQRILPMIISNAQRPVELECFGSIGCNREVFKKILHCAYSYFTVLSQIRDYNLQTLRISKDPRV